MRIKNTDRITVRIPKKLKQDIAFATTEVGVTRSDFIRSALRREVALIKARIARSRE